MARFPPRRILVACDLTPGCRGAWRYALALGRATGAEVEAVHVVEWLTPEGVLIPELLTRATRRVLLQRMSREFPGAARLHLSEGLAVVGILATARRRRADLIVVATGGRKGFARLAAASVAEAVVRESPVPVLDFKSTRRPALRVRSVLAPVCLRDYAAVGLELAAETARALGARLTILHVAAGADAKKEASRRLDRAVALLPAELREALRPAAVVTVGEPAAEIAAEAVRHDLVVLVARRKGFLTELWTGTTAERVLRRSRAPVMTVPAGGL